VTKKKTGKKKEELR